MIELHYDDGGKEKCEEKYVRPENDIVVGDRAEGNYKKKGNWYPGTTAQEGRKGHSARAIGCKFLLKYDDGAQEGQSRYLRVVIKRRDGEQVNDVAQVDDNDETKALLEVEEETKY